MKAIKIYAKDSKYFMEDLDTNITTELTNSKHVNKDDTDWFKLPENSANRKCVCKQMLDRKGEITYDYKETKTFGPRDPDAPKTTKSHKVNLDEYYTDEERAKIEKLNAQIAKINEAVMERAKAEIKKNELKETLKAIDPEVLKAIMNEIM